MNFGIVELYCGASGKKGFYNSQEIGLARAMKKLGYTCFIFYPARDAENVAEEQVEEGITIIYCPAKTIGVHSKYDWTVLEKYHIDAVQIGSDNQFFAPNLIRYCDRHKIPVYSLIGTVGTDSPSKIKRILMGLLYKRNLAAYCSHMNFAKTESVRLDLNAFGIPQIGLAPVGLDTSVIPDINGTQSEQKAECGLPEDKTILLYVGRIDTYKHPEDMLKVLKDLPDCYGVMIGDGALSDELASRIKELKLESHLTWIKRLANNEVQKYYRAADYYLNFNDQEIFGMSILEAMYQGCTVIAVHAPGPNSIIRDKETGYLVDRYSDMETLISSGVKLNPKTVKAYILDHFTWDQSASQFDNWIQAQRKWNGQ